MSFERIKKINGIEYKYLVENKRENGKVKQKIIQYLGRVDKEPMESTVSNGLVIPCGMYYFAQEGCHSCSPEKDIKENINKYISRSEKTLPQLTYINLSKEENPLSIVIRATPTFIFVNKQILYIGDWYDFLKGYIGEKKFNSIREEIYKEELKNHVLNGKKSRELIRMGYNKDDVNRCLGKPVITEKQKIKEEKEIKEEMERIEKIKAELNCKNGVCSISE